MAKYKVAVVSYLNTKPFLYGLEKSHLTDQIELNLAVPSACAEYLIKGAVHVALVPVAVLPQLPAYSIISDYCIGSNGSVETVCLFSNEPIEEIKKVYLDAHSKTSNQLIQVLNKRHWKQEIEWGPFFSEETIFKKNEGVLLIGDKVFQKREEYAYQYDLSEYWMHLTGLPFVFAVWVTTTRLDKKFIRAFNNALKLGVDNIDKVLLSINTQKNVKKYLTEKIDYKLDTSKKKAINLFIKYLTDL